MWPDRVSNPGPLTFESGALPAGGTPKYWDRLVSANSADPGQPDHIGSQCLPSGCINCIVKLYCFILTRFSN